MAASSTFRCVVSVLAFFGVLQASGLGQLQRPPRKASVGAEGQRFSQVMNNFGDLQYTATIEVGGQQLEGVLDTGSFELLVFSSRCGSCEGAHGFYNDSASALYRRHPANLTTKHSFGSGDTWSELAYDEVDIGPLKVEQQYFWEVTDAALPILKSDRFQAIVGVGPPATLKRESWTMMVTSEAEELAYEAMGGASPSEYSERTQFAWIMGQQQTLLDRLHVNTFSVCLRRGAGEPGQFVWRDTDPREQPEKFTAIPVAGAAHWGAQLQSMKLEGGSDGTALTLACEQGCGAVVDSGTSLIVVPTDVGRMAQEVINELPNANCSDLSSFPNLNFVLGGVQFSLPPEAYIMQIEGELPPGPMRWAARRLGYSTTVHDCELAVMTMDVESQLGPMFILGMPFFREFYTTFQRGPGSVFAGSKRSIYVSRADDDCEPTAQGTTLLQQQSRRQPRRIDLSSVVLPHWLGAAANKGSIQI
eukprot:CAMPEP_0170603442 /NCGR_PEP_ID=MMETSP0224-20130122/18914_1 /TAXON_ID=285029 /ORGANISM="Togula jolla, Strain CCCM 725" /LENGTH=474 /DNA_ID=CAMNT_0010928323 /DNA_START=61 /DNA_END=1485 /DNA_ORIENTATION=-